MPDNEPKEGDSGTCSCGQPGTYQIEPYALDVYGVENLVCLCDECYRSNCDDI